LADDVRVFSSPLPGGAAVHLTATAERLPRRTGPLRIVRVQECAGDVLECAAGDGLFAPAPLRASKDLTRNN
jgi:hypothetical protein